MAQLFAFDEFQGPNERAVVEQLASELPQSWILICNKQIVQNDHSREVDLICISPRMVFVIEEKGWSGVIRGTENGWLISGEMRSSPLNQCEMSSKMLAGILKNRQPQLNDYGSSLVTGIVLLSSPRVEVQINDSRSRKRVIHLPDAAKKLIALDASSENPPLGDLQLKIRDHLTRMPQRKQTPERIGEFLIAEQLDPQFGCQVYRGTHSDGSQRILKVFYGINALEEAPTGDTSVRRQYDAQRKLAVDDLCPPVDPYFTWDDGRAMVLAFSPAKGKNLGQLAVNGPPPEHVLPVLLAAFKTLRQVFEHGVIHRSLRPDRVWWDHMAEKVRLSDFLIARLDGQETVVDRADQFDVDHPYWAYESRVDLAYATHSSDVYSLAAVLLNWITAAEPPSDECWSPSPLTELRKDLDPEFALQIETALYPAFQLEPCSRPAAAAMEATLQALIDARKAVAAAQKSAEGVQPQLDDPRYQVLHSLGKGGTAETFLARDNHRDELVVLKRLMRPDVHGYLATTEFRALNRLRHECLPKLIDIYGPNDRFHLKFEYIEGRSLKDAWRQYRGCGSEQKLAIVRRISTDILDALEYLHANNFLHRDVTPGNILIPDDERSRIRLIDLGLASDIEHAISRVGTPLYLAPEIEQAIPAWSAQCDLYGLGVLLFELLAEKLPYVVDGNRRFKDKLIEFEPTPPAGLIDSLIVLLRNRACDPKPASRFSSAAEMRSAILALYRDWERRNEEAAEVQTVDISGQTTAVVESEPTSPQINSFVSELRQAFRNSKLGNTNNRGMDNDFSRNTYVRTELDNLLPDILSGKWKCVALSGNPGDGKTAFLEEVRRELMSQGAEVCYINAAGWKLRFKEHDFVSVYDASESHEGTSADELLKAAIEPLSGRSRPNATYTVLLAINDGRLQDLVTAHRLTFRWLCGALREHMQAKPSADKEVLLIDLKHRSPIAGSRANQPSLFPGLLDAFVQPENWSICQKCSAYRDCSIRANAVALRSSRPRDQLVEILAGVYFLAERRPTIRDLRSALSWLIAGDKDCQQVHEEVVEGISHDHRYYNLAFDVSAGEDLVLSSFRGLDPASVVNPKLDRQLAIGNPARFFASAEVHHPVSSGGTTDMLTDLKRRSYFESGFESGNLEALLPPRSISQFFGLVSGELDLKAVLPMILSGLQRFDRIPPHAANDELALRLDSTEASLIVVRKWDAVEFVLELPAEPPTVLNHLPDHLIFRHVDGWPEMAIGLQMYEILQRAADGLTPDATEHQSLLMDFERFKAQLLTRPTHEVILVNAGGDKSLVTSVNGRIERKVLEVQS